ncbi:MAG: MBL fold metallo-hydrolase [Pseudomonadota bacterium]
MTAPLLGEARATHHRFVLGAFEVTSVLDGAGVRDGIHPIFGHDQSKETFAAYANERHMPADRYEHSFAPALVNTGEALVLFDAGLGAMGREGGAGLLTKRMAEAGIPAEAVDVVVITHSHPDHIAGLWEGAKPAFPNARYAIGQVEYDGWSSGEKIPEQRKINRDLFLKLLPPLAHKTTFLQPGDSVVPGITAVETYGHSVGHMSFMIESGGKSLFLWGDVANHFVFSVEKPEWGVSFDDLPEEAIATRKRVLDWAATDQLDILGFHMPFPALGRVERYGNSFRWVPESYRLKV